MSRMSMCVWFCFIFFSNNKLIIAQVQLSKTFPPPTIKKQCCCMYCTNLSFCNEGNCDKRADKCKLVHLTCLLIEFDNVVNFVDSQSYCIKMFLTLHKTSKFLETLRSFSKPFSVYKKRKIMSCSLWKVRVIHKGITRH